MTDRELFEELADIEHQRWSDWQKYMHSCCTESSVNAGDLVIPAKLVKQWKRKIATNYADFSEKEKESDRDQVRRYWALIAQKGTVIIGQNVKVLLPGERPWVEVIEENGGLFKGRIINWLYRELSEHEEVIKARFMKREFGNVESLPELHTFKQGDEVWFEKGTDEHDGWWVPVEDKQVQSDE